MSELLQVTALLAVLAFLAISLWALFVFTYRTWLQLGERFSQCDANSELLRAAPEMLRALEAIKGKLEAYDPTCPFSEAERFLARAREAKKALNRRRTLLCLMGKSAWQLSRYLAGVRKGQQHSIRIGTFS